MDLLDRLQYQVASHFQLRIMKGRFLFDTSILDVDKENSS